MSTKTGQLQTDANSVRAYRYTPPSDDTQPKPDNNPPTIARFDPQLARLVSAKLASTPMTISEPARAIDDIPPAPVTNLLITQELEGTGAEAIGAAVEEFGAVGAIARPLYTTYVVPFEITGILLLVAIVGAVALAKRNVT